MRIGFVVGARPNFMKVAPILKALEQRPDVASLLIHTGQHYDRNLSDVFFEDLGIRRPDVSLEVGSGSHGKQTADIISALEPVLANASRSVEGLDRLVVVGDVNSTMAAAITAVKLGIPVAHVEAGLRSFDREMPEEINRILTDSISDLLLVSEPAGVENLLREGHSRDSIHLVGNVMIDTLRAQVDRARRLNILESLGLQPGQFGVVTLHRPSNVDDPEVLRKLLAVMADTSQHLPLVFPVHPRTAQRIEQFGLQSLLDVVGIRRLEPLGYLEFLALTSRAKLIVTDSGGLQEESTALGVPCLTMRSNTERPVTVEEGTSTLVGNSAELLHALLQDILHNRYKPGGCPVLWDGAAGQRIVDIVCQKCLVC